MGAWMKVKLTQVCSSISDGDHLPPPKCESGIPFVTISDIKNNKFDLSNTRFVPKAYFDTIDEKRRIRKGDVLYSVVGSYGIPVYADKDLEIAFQRHIAILKPSDIVDSRFLYYSMLNPAFYNAADNVAIGAAQKTITLSALRNLEIPLPPLPIQRHIADVLSAYDDLIENNRRRIALLEKSARLLYKEWFVRLRFPGHERISIEDGVPKGWKRTTLGDVCKTNRSSYRASELPPSINYIDISSVSEGRIIGKTAMLAKASPGRARRKAQSGDVIWSNVRPNLKAYALVLNPEPNDVFSTGFTILTPTTIPFSFLYLFVSTDSFVSYLENMVTGATYPAVRPSDFEQATVLLPDSETLHQFHSFVAPLFLQCNTLERQSAALAASRDMLLPRLMKGDAV